MMKKILMGILGLFFCLSLAIVGNVFSQEISPEYEVLNASIMRPDRATRLQWMMEYETVERAPIDEEIQRRLDAQARGEEAKGPAPILLDHITYTASERNQAGCGNCWVWAGTGVLEIFHSVFYGVKDRLSTQYFDSCASGSYACCGGNLTRFATFYSEDENPIPWYNTNAQFQDGSRNCSSGSSLVTCGSIESKRRRVSI